MTSFTNIFIMDKEPIDKYEFRGSMFMVNEELIDNSKSEVNVKLFYTLIRIKAGPQTAVKRMICLNNEGYKEQYKDENNGKLPPPRMIEQQTETVAKWCFEAEQVILEAAGVLGLKLPT